MLFIAYFLLTVATLLVATRMQGMGTMASPADAPYSGLNLFPAGEGFTLASYGILSIAGIVVYALIVTRRARPGGAPADGREWFWIMLMLLTAAAAPAFTSSDIYYYAGVARVQALHGGNPYIQTIASTGDTSITTGVTLWAGVPTMYAPAMTSLFGMLGFLSGGSTAVFVVLYRLVVLGLFLGAGRLVGLIADRFLYGLGEAATLAFLLNPLAVHEILMNGHNDVLPLFFLVLAIFFALHESFFGAFVTLAVAGLFKFPVLAVAPFFVAFAAQRKGFAGALKAGLLASAVLLPLVGLFYWIYFRNPASLAAYKILSNYMSPSTPIFLSLGLGELGGVDEARVLKFGKKVIAFFKYAYVLFVFYRAWKLFRLPAVEARRFLLEVGLALLVFYGLATSYIWPWYWLLISPFFFVEREGDFFTVGLAVALGGVLFWIAFILMGPVDDLFTKFGAQYAFFFGPLILAFLPPIRKRLRAFYGFGESTAGA